MDSSCAGYGQISGFCWRGTERYILGSYSWFDKDSRYLSNRASYFMHVKATRSKETLASICQSTQKTLNVQDSADHKSKKFLNTRVLLAQWTCQVLNFDPNIFIHFLINSFLMTPLRLQPPIIILRCAWLWCNIHNLHTPATAFYYTFSIHIRQGSNPSSANTQHNYNKKFAKLFLSINYGRKLNCCYC